MLTLQPVQVGTGHDSDGLLVFSSGVLVAILVRLSEDHENAAGSWFLEVGFGALNGVSHPVFENLEKAQEWIAGRLSRDCAPVLASPWLP